MVLRGSYFISTLPKVTVYFFYLLSFFYEYFLLCRKIEWGFHSWGNFVGKTRIFVELIFYKKNIYGLCCSHVMDLHSFHQNKCHELWVHRHSLHHGPWKIHDHLRSLCLHSTNNSALIVVGRNAFIFANHYTFSSNCGFFFFFGFYKYFTVKGA